MFLHIRENHPQNKHTTHRVGESFCCTSDKIQLYFNKEVDSTVYKELKELNNKNEASIEKWDNEMKLTKEETEMDKNIFKSPKHP